MDELAKINPKSSSDNDAFVKSLHNMVSLQMKHLGYALRYHNEQYPHDHIILQDVMTDLLRSSVIQHIDRRTTGFTHDRCR